MAAFISLISVCNSPTITFAFNDSNKDSNTEFFSKCRINHYANSGNDLLPTSTYIRPPLPCSDGSRLEHPQDRVAWRRQLQLGGRRSLEPPRELPGPQPEGTCRPLGQGQGSHMVRQGRWRRRRRRRGRRRGRRLVRRVYRNTRGEGGARTARGDQEGQGNGRGGPRQRPRPARRAQEGYGRERRRRRRAETRRRRSGGGCRTGPYAGAGRRTRK